MSSTRLAHLALGFTAIFSTLASSQTLLTYGSGGLPTCAQQCATLTAAQTACVPPTAPTTDTTAYWVCFCSSASLNPLWQSASAAFCAPECGANDQSAIVSWFKTNCGSDNGETEHGGSGTTTAGTAASTSANAAASAPSTTSVSGAPVTSPQPAEQGSWWSNHWKWIVMVIVILVAFLLIALLGLWLKRRHDRKQDLITSGFNAGITTRTTPMSTSKSRNIMSGGYETGSGRDTPNRTREAFMPYGNSYSRSESRLARGTPRGATPVNELEKEVGMTRKGKEPQVNEASAEGPESPEIEKVR